MKKLFIALVMGVMAFGASAQDMFDNPNNRAYLGARVGLDITSASDGNGIYNNGFGFNLGAIYNIPVWKNLYFEPGLSVFYNTIGQEVSYMDEEMEPIIIDGSIRNLGFRAPLVGGYRFDLSEDMAVNVYTGPQINWSLVARSHWNDGRMTSESIFGDGGFKHFDLQWVFGAGFSWQQYYVAVSGAVGCTKVYDFGIVEFRRNAFTITLGYNF